MDSLPELPRRKRSAETELTKDNVATFDSHPEDASQGLKKGFKKADEDTMRHRQRVSVRRGMLGAAPTTKHDISAILNDENDKPSPPAHLVPKPSVASWTSIAPNPNIFKVPTYNTMNFGHSSEAASTADSSESTATSAASNGHSEASKQESSKPMSFAPKPLSFASLSKDSKSQQGSEAASKVSQVKTDSKGDSASKDSDISGTSDNGPSTPSASKPGNPFGGFKFSPVSGTSPFSKALSASPKESLFKNVVFGKQTASVSPSSTPQSTSKDAQASGEGPGISTSSPTASSTSSETVTSSIDPSQPQTLATAPSPASAAPKKWTFLSQTSASSSSAAKSTWQPTPLSTLFNKKPTDVSTSPGAATKAVDFSMFGKNVAPKSDGQTPPSGSTPVAPNVAAVIASKTTAQTPSAFSDAPVLSGEENETVLFSAEAKLFEFEAEKKIWAEKGTGQFKLNQLNTDASKLRLVMHANSTYKLLLNSPVFSSMVCQVMDNQPVRIKLTALVLNQPSTNAQKDSASATESSASSTEPSASSSPSTSSSSLKVLSLRFRDSETAARAVVKINDAIKLKTSSDASASSTNTVPTSSQSKSTNEETKDSTTSKNAEEKNEQH